MRLFTFTGIVVSLLGLAMTGCGSDEGSTPVAANEGFDPAYKLSWTDPVQDKNFFLLSTMLRQEEVRLALRADSRLNQLSQSILADFTQALGSCGDNALCLANALLLDEAQIEALATALMGLAREPALKQLIDEHLRPSGVFERFAFANDEALLKQAWEEAASGLNFILQVYLLGAIPVDADSDGPKFEVNDLAYQRAAMARARQTANSITAESLFFEPLLQWCMHLLELNNRDEAGRYEPLQAGENQKALNRLSSVEFGNFEYSVIVCLGDSPNSAGDAINLSEGAKVRIALAVGRYQQGKAPFILFTGSNVFPNHTPYHEAIEMKKWAMEQHGIPEEAIVVEPYARHTTTNLRNASRLLFRYGLSGGKGPVWSPPRNHKPIM